MKSNKAVRVFTAPPLPVGYFAPASQEEPVSSSLGSSAIPDVTIPPLHRDYWNLVQSKIPSLAGAAATAMQMDTGQDDDDHEEKEAVRGERRTIHELFHEMRKEIDTSGSPACIVSQDQKWIVPFFPANELGTKMATTWLVAVPAMVLRVGRNRYVDEATAFASARMLLPTIVHESPLATLLAREALGSNVGVGGSSAISSSVGGTKSGGGAIAPVPRFTDALTSYINLYVFQKILREMDTSQGEHKSVADKYSKLLIHRAGDTLYRELDSLYAKLTTLAKTDRRGIEEVTVAFARAAEVYALTHIHILEWFILDMCRVPFKARPGLMTPNMLHLHANALTSTGFDIMRSLLCQSMRNRQLIFPEEIPSIKDDAIKLKTERPLDNDAPCKIEDRLTLLASYVHGQTPEHVARQSLFGVYNGWIDIHTLHQFMVFLAPDEPQPQQQETASVGRQEAAAVAKMDVSE